MLQDGVGSAAQTAFLQLARSGSQSETDKSFATLMPLPVEAQGASVTLIGFATDRFSHERGEQPLNVLLQQPLSLDELAPRARLVSPVAGTVAIPMQQMDLNLGFSDDSLALKSLRLLENRSRTVHDLGVSYGQTTWQVPYTVPKGFTSGELELTLIAEDFSGRSSEHSLIYPLQANEKPQLTFAGFNTYWVNGHYEKALTLSLIHI